MSGWEHQGCADKGVVEDDALKAVDAIKTQSSTTVF